MVLTSTKQFLLSLLFAVQNKLHLFLLTYHCQILCCLDYRWIFGCRATARTTVTHRAAVGPEDAAGLGVNWGWCCRMPSATSAGSCGATAPGCGCNSTHRNSQRSHGISFSPRSKRFQGCSIHKNTFFFILWTLLQNVFTSYCQIFNIFLISRTSGQNFQTNNKFSYHIQEEPPSKQASQNLRIQPLKSIFKVSLKIKWTFSLPI